MEIERKFLIDGFPALPGEQRAVMRQGYLCTKPTVRIRSKEEHGKTGYRLCIKGEGTLSREEIELELTAGQFQRLEALLPMEPVRKDYRAYPLEGGLTLECSHVDPGAPTAFYYAEVEFPTVEAANAFTPPPYLGREVTEEPGNTMGAYWRRKLAAVRHGSPPRGSGNL